MFYKWQAKSKTDLTAKAVHNTLRKSKIDWKVPAERRIAKFVKRTNSRIAKTTEGGGKSGILRMFFKGDRASNYSVIPKQPNHIGNCSTDASVVSNESQRKKKFRQAGASMLKAISPMVKHKKTNQGIGTRSTTDLFRKSKAPTNSAPIPYAQAESERTASKQPTKAPNADSVSANSTSNPPAVVYQTKTVIENVQEVDRIKALDNSMRDFGGKGDVSEVKQPTDAVKDVAADAYFDDNAKSQKENMCCSFFLW